MVPVFSASVSAAVVSASVVSAAVVSAAVVVVSALGLWAGWLEHPATDSTIAAVRTADISFLPDFLMFSSLLSHGLSVNP
jgi:hypothetical protein